MKISIDTWSLDDIYSPNFYYDHLYKSLPESQQSTVDIVNMIPATIVNQLFRGSYEYLTTWIESLDYNDFTIVMEFLYTQNPDQLVPYISNHVNYIAIIRFDNIIAALEPSFNASIQKQLLIQIDIFSNNINIIDYINNIQTLKYLICIYYTNSYIYVYCSKKKHNQIFDSVFLNFNYNLKHVMKLNKQTIHIYENKACSTGKIR